MILYYVLLLVLTLFEAVGSVFLKKASGADGILALLKEPRFFLGGFLYFTAALLNIYVLRFLDYSVAFPLKSFTFIWTVLLGYYAVGEKITRRKLAGVALIILGAVLISL